MKTDQLAERLSERLDPVPKRAAGRTLAAGLGAGALVSLILVAAALGLRRDFADAAATWSFWAKFFYTLGFAALGFFTIERLARPGVRAGREAVLEALPFLAMAAVAVFEWSTAPAVEHTKLLYGSSYLVCPWLIVTVSLPLLAGTVWGLKRLAPTRLVVAGAAAGFLAGAAGAWIYALHCTESSAVFVAVWYSLGIALTGLLGALIGRWALRW